MLHKNSQKRIYSSDAIYFVTCKTKNNFPFFREDFFCELWIEELGFCKKIKEFDLFGFCLLPDHFHMVFRPRGNENLSRVMQFLKRHFSRNANQISGHSAEGDISQCRLRDEFKNLSEIISRHGEKVQIFKERIKNSLPKFQWQKSFHDHIIRGDRDFENCLQYTVENFLKHGLPGNWRYTSLNYPKLIDAF
ncbi:MAG: transposase [Patescibacteria group bacterium]